MWRAATLKKKLLNAWTTFQWKWLPSEDTAPEHPHFPICKTGIIIVISYRAFYHFNRCKAENIIFLKSSRNKKRHSAVNRVGTSLDRTVPSGKMREAQVDPGTVQWEKWKERATGRRVRRRRQEQRTELMPGTWAHLLWGWGQCWQA